MKHVKIYQEPGRYAGWPANYGIWSWGDEIVVGFTVGYHKSDAGFHSRDRDRPFVATQARSTDGGESWSVSDMPARTPEGEGLSAGEHGTGDPQVNGDALEDSLDPCPGVVDFTHPDFALMCGRTHVRAGSASWFYTSTDRCRSWEGPYAVPMFGQKGMAARTDYQVVGSREVILFLTSTKEDGGEGRVFVARTDDGGATLQFLSWVGPEDPQGFAIMPASVRVGEDGYLVSIRCRERSGENERNWIDLYRSDDGARSWSHIARPAEETGIGGNPPAMIRLKDGRICLVYGFRDSPSGMRATLSSDDGATWQETVLRDDGGNHDVGYPRAVQRPDGSVVAVYYYNDTSEGERYVAATIWKP